ncbi:deoxyguanosinetriphosphate triphosphohydrolase [Fulvivirga sp. RKSG066]|uniref:deoxyguanosinetriphosphate triphosphohydrolase n=1 Tax=Fulvivirga aurantia TaxID=2529383 RepID=UPI0012BC7D3A|nr:deoxyguanosinetriphosphate triphosphohydrolase [Fulvivirga aurantia]MTI23295.1 deoxyguanosinetriphosphate triphosphohydrolase [Fulvivirga aurantia]
MEWKQLLSNQRKGQNKQEHNVGRSAFEQDYDRIIFSHPFRRLQDKTQVHPLPEHDFVHTRLTHSLEVSSVGRSLGKLAAETLLQRHKELQSTYSIHDFGAIVAAASLTHDIGNPPFGHSGEDSISEFFKFGEGQAYQRLVSEAEWQDLTNFEGNAQGFRILNKDRYQGLKLTYATLAAFTKYPRQSIIANPDKSRRSQKKFGFFQAEKETFKEIAEQTGLLNYGDYTWGRHPLAFLVEAADDICYNLIDLEDGCRLGLVSFDETVELFAMILKERFNKEKLERIDSLDERIGTLRAMSVGKLIAECNELFIDNEQSIFDGSFDQALTDEIPSAEVLEKVVALSIKKIYRSRLVMETEAAGFEVLPGLLEAFTSAVIEEENHRKKHVSLLRLMPEEVLREIRREQSSVYDKLMCCVDFVSGLTDTHAISLFRKIKGISHPNA